MWKHLPFAEVLPFIISHPVVGQVIIINNNGVMFGTESIEKGSTSKEIYPSFLLPTAKYELLATAFGGIGRCVRTPQELDQALDEMLSDNNLWVLNVMINPYATNKP